MKTNSFSVSEALSFGWEKVKANFLFFILLMIVSFVGPNLFYMIKGLLGLDSAFYNLAFSLASWILSIIISMGVLKIYLKVVDGQPYKLEDILSTAHLWLKYLIGSILYVVIVMIGLLLLIVPGIILAVKYQYLMYLVIDEELGPLEALGKSGRITNGNKFNLFIWGLIMALVNAVGVLAFFVGLFVTIPLTSVASAYVYRKLSKEVV
ncbi:DUF975 family protein [Candidatus Microgenomates bacterium]|nr:DUF975 family protein [Candidatus Microgenomates bacterium]